MVLSGPPLKYDNSVITESSMEDLERIEVAYGLFENYKKMTPPKTVPKVILKRRGKSAFDDGALGFRDWNPC